MKHAFSLFFRTYDDIVFQFFLLFHRAV